MSSIRSCLAQCQVTRQALLNHILRSVWCLHILTLKWKSKLDRVSSLSEGLRVVDRDDLWLFSHQQNIEVVGAWCDWLDNCFLSNNTNNGIAGNCAYFHSNNTITVEVIQLCLKTCSNGLTSTLHQASLLKCPYHQQARKGFITTRFRFKYQKFQ